MIRKAFFSDNRFLLKKKNLLFVLVFVLLSPDFSKAAAPATAQIAAACITGVIMSVIGYCADQDRDRTEQRIEQREEKDAEFQQQKWEDQRQREMKRREEERQKHELEMQLMQKQLEEQRQREEEQRKQEEERKRLEKSAALLQVWTLSQLKKGREKKGRESNLKEEWFFAKEKDWSINPEIGNRFSDIVSLETNGISDVPKVWDSYNTEFETDEVVIFERNNFKSATDFRSGINLPPLKEPILFKFDNREEGGIMSTDIIDETDEEYSNRILGLSLSSCLEDCSESKEEWEALGEYFFGAYEYFGSAYRVSLVVEEQAEDKKDKASIYGNHFVYGGNYKEGPSKDEVDSALREVSDEAVVWLLGLKEEDYNEILPKKQMGFGVEVLRDDSVILPFLSSSYLRKDSSFVFSKTETEDMENVFSQVSSIAEEMALKLNNRGSIGTGDLMQGALNKELTFGVDFNSIIADSIEKDSDNKESLIWNNGEIESMSQKEEPDGIYKTFEGTSTDILGDHHYRIRFIIEERGPQSWVQEDTWKKKAVMTEYVNVSFL